ncbi:MAG: protein-L-isoaspartate(D-aspartate) O-methyltransferase [Gammaproteobacteria bacterium]|nr:protein-L-isoaspartate(D-aspartate) O-methyltransferase [Gammaproteobacteria bacterium]
MKIFICLLLIVSIAASADDFAEQRREMVDELKLFAELVQDDDAIRFSDPVIQAMNNVERHRMVPSSQQRYAYENRPLPIGHGQTISQPYIVALMTELVDPDPGDRVLEVGTGSGYQAAVLAELVDHVYSIEIIAALASQAGERLDYLGYDNITSKLGDGYFGWEDHAPFDAIVVTAAASHVPPPLIEQLKPGGRMIIPVGPRFMTQTLLLLEKNDSGEVITRQYGAVRFVPLTGKH